MSRRAFFHHRCERGITITEVVVASALLLVSIVPILHALTIAQTTARVIEQKTRSLTLAQGRLDEIRARATANYDQSFAQSSVALDGAYRCTVLDSYSVLSNLRTITVSVGYDSNGNGTLATGEIQVTLKTQIARREQASSLPVRVLSPIPIPAWVYAAA